MIQSEIDAKTRVADLRFRMRYSFAFGVLMLAIGIAFVADYLNAFYGNGWDPLQMRHLQNDTASRVFVIILLVIAFVLGIWKLVSAFVIRRDLVSQR